MRIAPGGCDKTEAGVLVRNHEGQLCDTPFQAPSSVLSPVPSGMNVMGDRVYRAEHGPPLS
ncbi:MAG: hypothetical protein KatS3mg107_0688 [Gemmataceae bacterium]|jgi:hypothetical protein|nr:MAG: hypothetical protein KatS3mg107_0688 [Gemmataceae bacterium]